MLRRHEMSPKTISSTSSADSADEHDEDRKRNHNPVIHSIHIRRPCLIQCFRESCKIVTYQITHAKPSRALSCPQYTNVFCVLAGTIKDCESGSNLGAISSWECVPAVQPSTKAGSDSGGTSRPEYPRKEQTEEHHRSGSVREPVIELKECRRLTRCHAITH